MTINNLLSDFNFNAEHDAFRVILPQKRHEWQKYSSTRLQWTEKEVVGYNDD